MDVENWQAARIRNSRLYLQNSAVKPWPWGIQVQVLGARGSGRHSLLNRICLDDPGAECDSGCKQAHIRNLPCSVWFDVPPSLTDHGDEFGLSKDELRTWITRGFRDCDALILAYDLTNEKSFQALGKFVRRCDMEGLAVAMGKSLPCLVVGTKCDRPMTRLLHVEDGEKLARKLGGTFLQISSRTGEGFEQLLEEAVDPVLDARINLMHESEEALGEAIRELMAPRSEKRHRLRKFASKNPPKPEPRRRRRPVSPARCNGAPPRWTMRDVPSLLLPAWSSPSHRANDSDVNSEEATLLIPCPPEYQLSVDLVEPAATWRAQDLIDGVWSAGLGRLPV